MVDLAGLIEDLRDEHSDLDRVVADLPERQWDEPTPAVPWTIRDQISHLAFFDEQAALAASDPEAFLTSLSVVVDADAFMNGPLERGRAMSSEGVLAWWREVRESMLGGFRALDPSVRIPWFGPPMSPASFISARLMETWAHGQDVADALGVERTPTARLKHVAHLGVRARGYSYSAHGKSSPDEPVAVELTAPEGETWSWDSDAEALVEGSALGFCLVVTQRRHIDDTNLRVTGSAADGMDVDRPSVRRSPGRRPSPGTVSEGRLMQALRWVAFAFGVLFVAVERAQPCREPGGASPTCIAAVDRHRGVRP